MQRLFVTLCLAGGLAGFVAAQGSADGRRVPERRIEAAVPSPLWEPPPMPPEATAVPALTFRLVTDRTDEHGTRRVSEQTITRTANRIHLAPNGSPREWVFERNPVDSRRMSGYRIDHQARQIVIHQESDLRNREQLRGWADVWFMRFDPRQLASMRRTEQTQVIGAFRFVRHTSTGESAGEAAEVAWSDQLLLPGMLVYRQSGATTTSRVDSLQVLADTPELGDPRHRYPEYTVVDLADVGDHRH
jgi:hypothetical protein